MSFYKGQEREVKAFMKNKTKSKISQRKNRGITLIALVITIIVLLILAGISISMLSRR